MAPPPSASGAARRAVAPQPRPSSRRPSLRVVQPERRRRSRRGRSSRVQLGLAAGLVVGSLLAVVVGDAMVAQDQVRLADIQSSIATQQATQKTMQTEVAQLAAPDRVVAQGIALGLTAPAQVLNLPEVPLNVPLPAPQTAPTTAPAARAATTTPAATTAPAATTTPAATTATGTPTAATATATTAR